MRSYLTKSTLLLLVLGLYYPLLSQDIKNNTIDKPKENQIKENETLITRNIIGFIPSSADKINGWAIGYFFLSDDDLSDYKMQVINGVYTNLSPLQAIFGVYAILTSMWSFVGADGLNIETQNKTIYSKYIGKDTLGINQELNGISLSIVDIGDRARINGIDISILSQYSNQMNGFSFSGLFNNKTFLRGFMFGLINISEQVKGVQCGLVNNCGTLKGVQLGLININGGKFFPFINIGFNRHPKN